MSTQIISAPPTPVLPNKSQPPPAIDFTKILLRPSEVLQIWYEVFQEHGYPHLPPPPAPLKPPNPTNLVPATAPILESHAVRSSLQTPSQLSSPPSSSPPPDSPTSPITPPSTPSSPVPICDTLHGNPHSPPPSPLYYEAKGLLIAPIDPAHNTSARRTRRWGKFCLRLRKEEEVKQMRCKKQIEVLEGWWEEGGVMVWVRKEVWRRCAGMAGVWVEQNEGNEAE